MVVDPHTGRGLVSLGRGDSFQLIVHSIWNRANSDGGFTLPVAPVAGARVVGSDPWVHMTGLARADEDSQWLGNQGIISARIIGATPSTSQPKPAAEVNAILECELSGDRLLLQRSQRDLGSQLSTGFIVDGHWLVIPVSPGSEPGWRSTWDSHNDQTHVRVINNIVDSKRLVLWRSTRAGAGDVLSRAIPRIRSEVAGVESVNLGVAVVSPLQPAFGSPPPQPIIDRFVNRWGERASDAPPILEILEADRDWPKTLQLVVARSPVSVSYAEELRLEQGLLEVRLQATVQASQSTNARVEVTIPQALMLDRVDGEGLLRWSRPTPDRLLLFLSEQTAQLALQGRIRLPVDPLTNSRQPHPIEVPRFHWLDASLGSATLDVFAPLEFSLDFSNTSGLKPEASVPMDRRPGYRGHFRLESIDVSSVFDWSVAGQTADVKVMSHIGIFQGLVIWRARADYFVADGPIHQLFLELPTEWAKNAVASVEGGESKIDFIPAGSRTRLEVHFPNPRWGRVTLRLESQRPVTGESVTFPDASPLGLGRVDTYLAWSDLASQQLVAEGTSGIQPVERSRFDVSWLPQAEVAQPRVYHVLRDGWSLSIRSRQESKGSSRSSDALVIKRLNQSRLMPVSRRSVR